MSIFLRAAYVLLISSIGFSTLTIADEYHYNNMLIGDRASGMGGAYTAISDDATGMFYNPAGILYVGERNFSASVNAYYSQSKKYENVIGNRPFERNSSALLANFFGIVKPMGSFKVGFSYAVPDAVSEDQNQNFSNVSSTVSRFTMNLNNRDSTYNFGPSIAAELDNDLSVGLSLYIHKRDVQLILNQFQERVDSSNQWSNYYFKLSETGARPVLGIMWSPVDKLSLGASLSQTWVISATGEGQSTCWDSSAVECSASILQAPSTVGFTSKRKYPVRMAVGAAYFPDSNLILSGDLTYNTAITDANYGNKESTLNAAIGVEYYLNKNWAVRTGGYTNIANTPAIQAGVTSIEEKINLYGLSLSVSNFTNGSSITLGTSINYGKGKSQILNNTSVQDATTLGWLMFLSSSY
jgi:long-chain fatty acid transport protein